MSSPNFGRFQMEFEGIPIRVAAADSLVGLVVEAEARRIYRPDHETWERIGAIVASRYQISRDEAAQAIELRQLEETGGEANGQA